jgi:hypothetical protein
MAQPYPTRQQAHADIHKAIVGFYGRRYPELFRNRKADIEQAAARTVELYDGNVFPEMQVNWKTHVNNRGHKEWPGCFRCHDGRHASKSGKVLSRDCTICHTMPVRGPLQPLGVMSEGAPGAAAYWHPVDLSGKHGRIFCNRCHHGGDPVPSSCTQCHQIDPEAPMIDQGCDSCHRVPQEVTGMTDCRECHSPTGLHATAAHAGATCMAATSRTSGASRGGRPACSAMVT